MSIGGALAVAFAGPADAATTIHGSEPVAGQTLSCANNTYTATGGSINYVISETTSANGSFHITGTDRASGITAVDAAGNTYRIVGADWFGGTIFPDGRAVFTDTNNFQVISASGGVVDSVRVVEHASPNGQSFSFDFGTCAPPGG